MRALPMLSVSLLTLGSIGCGASTNEEREPGNPVAAGGAGSAAGASPGESPPTEPEAVSGIAPCPPLESGYQGDERCILSPEPGTGAHIHIGPNDYDDPAEVEPFLLMPGETTSGDVTAYYRLNSDNTEHINFYAQHYRMRPGSHHLFMSILPMRVPDAEIGWHAERAENGTLIGGTQRGIGDFPVKGVIPPEDVNLVRPLPAEWGMSFELHYVNVTEEPILREVWINLMKNETTTPQILGGVFMIGFEIGVPPGETHLLNHLSDPLSEGNKRIVSLFGHRHANTERFSAWVHRGGQRELVYEDYLWDDPSELLYNSVTDNGAPDRPSLRPGGHSGLLVLQPGDRIEWECEVRNQQAVTLYFGNEVYTAEMCNLFGGATSGTTPIFRLGSTFTRTVL